MILLVNGIGAFLPGEKLTKRETIATAMIGRGAGSAEYLKGLYTKNASPADSVKKQNLRGCLESVF